MLDVSAVTILNDEKLIASRDAHIGAMASLFEGRVGAKAFTLDGIYGSSGLDACADPEGWVDETLTNLAHRACDAKVFSEQSGIFRPLCIEFGPYGVHFSDRILGAEVFSEAGQWYNKCLTTPIGELRTPNLETDETWGIAKRLAQAFVAAGVRLPYFGLATVASALNVAVNLYGEEILVAMHTEPSAARRDLGVINDLLRAMHNWYRSVLPPEQLQAVVAGHRTQPPGFGQLCGCTTQLLSPGAYRDFIAPLDDALLSVYPNGGMMHLCGAHTQHIPVWREMRSLRAVQLNDRAAEDLGAYYEGLRDDQILYLNVFEGMTVDSAMDITGGHRLVLVGNVTPPTTGPRG